MAKLDVSQLLAAQETLLIPLWARAREAHHAEPILCDRRADEIVQSLDYDFGRFERAQVDQVGFCSRLRSSTPWCESISDSIPMQR